MKGLLRKDFYTFGQANPPKVAIPVALFIIGWCWWQQTASYAAMMVGLVVMMQVMSSFTYDEKTTWQGYAFSTPLPRRAIVLEKYLFAAINVGICILFSALCVLAQYLFFGSGALYQTIVLGNFAALAFSTSLVICIPLFFKYGVEKTRLISALGFLVPFGGLMAILIVFGEDALEQAMGLWVLLAYTAALLACGVVSYQICLRVVEKLEP